MVASPYRWSVGTKPLQVATFRFEVSGGEEAGKGYGWEGAGKALPLKKALPEQTAQVGGLMIGRSGFWAKETERYQSEEHVSEVSSLLCSQWPLRMKAE